MGVTCACQKIECEEEIVSRILSTMSLAEIETKSAYAEFLKCINKEDGYIDYFLFKNFISLVSGNNIYKNAQISFFENLRKSETRGGQNIKKIGTLIIFLSKGSQFQKIESLYQHYTKFYVNFDEKTVKEFINDLIEANTDNCIQSFRENLDHEVIQNMSEIYKNLRKKLLLHHIFNNFERVKIKYFHQAPKYLDEKPDKLNTSLDVDGNFDNDNKDDLAEVYERYNKNQCDLLNHPFTLEAKKFCEDEKIIKEFFELAYNFMSGEYIRNWLSEDYLKEKSYENVCI